MNVLGETSASYPLARWIDRVPLFLVGYVFVLGVVLFLIAGRGAWLVFALWTAAGLSLAYALRVSMTYRIDTDASQIVFSRRRSTVAIPWSELAGVVSSGRYNLVWSSERAKVITLRSFDRFPNLLDEVAARAPQCKVHLT